MTTSALPAKAIYLANRNPALSRPEFRDRWLRHPRVTTILNDEAGDAAMVSGRYCLATDRPHGLRYATTELDGVALIGLASLASIPVFDTSLTQNEIAYADELRTFARPVEDAVLYGASELLLAGDETETVLLYLERRQKGATPEAHLAAADDALGEALEQAERLGVRRWVRNVRIARAARGSAYDVVTELWFESADVWAAEPAAVEALLTSLSPLTEPRASVVLLADVIVGYREQWP